ncbi:MAG: hypothetical protein U0183_15140 [Polyangiaceae bacterium]
MAMRRARVWLLSALGSASAVACASAFSGTPTPPGDDAAIATSLPTTIVPEASLDDTGAPIEADAGTDGAPTYSFSDDFERPDGALVPPWEETLVTRGTLSIQGPDGGRSRFLSSDTELGAGSQASCVRGFRANVLRSEASFRLRIAGFDQSDGGTNETLNLLSFRLDTGGPDGGTGPGHTIRVGLKKRSATRFALFVMSQFEGTQTRSNDSTITLDLGRDYEIRFFTDASTPRPGVPVARALVDGVEAVTLDGAGERVYDHLPVGRLFFPGGTQGGSGFHVELDDLSFVGRP